MSYVQNIVTSTSIKSRSLISLLGNGSKAGILLFSDLILARLYGPNDWGPISYEMVTAFAFFSLLEFSTGSAFYTHLSKQTKDQAYIKRYFSFLFLVYLIAIALVSIFYSTIHLNLNIEGSHKRLLTVLTYIFLSKFVFLSAVAIGEAAEKNYIAQLYSFATHFIHFTIVIIIYCAGKQVEPHKVFTIFSFLYLIASAGAIKAFSQYFRDRKPTNKNNKQNTKAELNEYLKYVGPLSVSIIFGAISYWMIRWLISKYGTPAELAYFNLSFQFCAALLLPVVAFNRIATSEVSKAVEALEITKITRITSAFEGVLLVIIVAAIFGGLLVSKQLIQIFIGTEYTAGLNIFILGLVQVYFQAQGQFYSTVAQGMGKTILNLRANIAPSIAIISIVTYFIFNPPEGRGPNIIASSAMILLTVSQYFTTGTLRKKLYNQLKYENKDSKFIERTSLLLLSSTMLIYAHFQFQDKNFQDTKIFIIKISAVFLLWTILERSQIKRAYYESLKILTTNYRKQQTESRENA